MKPFHIADTLNYCFEEEQKRGAQRLPHESFRQSYVDIEIDPTESDFRRHVKISTNRTPFRLPEKTLLDIISTLSGCQAVFLRSQAPLTEAHTKLYRNLPPNSAPFLEHIQMAGEICHKYDIFLVGGDRIVEGVERVSKENPSYRIDALHINDMEEHILDKADYLDNSFNTEFQKNQLGNAQNNSLEVSALEL